MTDGSLHENPAWVMGRSTLLLGAAVGSTVTVALGGAEGEAEGLDA